MSMYDDDRRARRSSPGNRWDEDDDLARLRDSGDARGRGRVGRNTSYGYGGETSGQGAGMARPSSGRGWDEDYGDRRSRGRYDAGQQRGDEEATWRSDRRDRRPRYADDAFGGRYGAAGPVEGAYGAGRSGGAYGDAAMPSGGSTMRGRGYGGGGATSSAASRAISGGFGGGRSGGMAGKGPKGYVRSDERIREDVCDRLTDDPDLDASAVDVQVRNGEVTLNGIVDTRQDKRHAEDLVDEISGVKHVQNNLKLQAGRQRGGTARTANTDIGPTS